MSTEMQTRIEALEKALNSERAHAAALHRENVALKGDLKAAKDLAYISGGMGQRTIDVVHELNRKLAQAEAGVERLANAIIQYVRTSQSIARENRNSLNDLLNLMEAISEEAGLPHLVALVYEAGKFHARTHDDSVKQAASDALACLGISQLPASANSDDVTENPSLHLGMAWGYNMDSAMTETMQSLLIHAYAHSDDPRAVADQILRECQRIGSPKMETLNMLPREWVSKNLVQNPSNRVLFDGLRMVQEWKSSEKSKELFCRDRGISDRAFRNYSSWWAMLEEAAHQLPTLKEG